MRELEDAISSSPWRFPAHPAALMISWTRIKCFTGLRSSGKPGPLITPLPANQGNQESCATGTMASVLRLGHESDSQDFGKTWSQFARLRRIHLSRCKARPAGTRLLCKYCTFCPFLTLHSHNFTTQTFPHSRPVLEQDLHSASQTSNWMFCFCYTCCLITEIYLHVL